MSASDTIISSKPNRRNSATSTQQPPTITSARASSRPGLWMRSAQRLGGERAEHVLGRVAGEHEVVDGVAVVGGEPDLDRGDRGDRAGQADERAGLGAAGDLADHVVEVGVGEADAGGQLLGQRRVVVEELLGQPHAADVDRHHALDVVGAEDELGRARRRCRRRGTGRGRGRGRRWRRGTTGAPRRRPTAARAARRRRPRPRRRTRRGWRRRGRRTWPRPARRSTPCSSRTARYSRRQASVRSTASSASRPVASDVLPQPGDRVAPVEDVELAVDRAGHQDAGRVGADVDGGDDGHLRDANAWPSRADPVVDPAPDRVVAAGEVPGVVGVQALHAGPGAADAARRAGAGVAGRQRRVALGRVAARGPRRGPRGRPRARPGRPRRRSRAGRPRCARARRPASTGSAWACRRRAAGRCGSRAASRRAWRTTTSNAPCGRRPSSRSTASTSAAEGAGGVTPGRATRLTRCTRHGCDRPLSSTSAPASNGDVAARRPSGRG